MTTAVPVKQFTNMYSEGLCDFPKDPPGSLYGFFCTPCLIGQIVADSSQGDCTQTAAILTCLSAIP